MKHIDSNIYFNKLRYTNETLEEARARVEKKRLYKLNKKNIIKK